MQVQNSNTVKHQKTSSKVCFYPCPCRCRCGAGRVGKVICGENLRRGERGETHRVQHDKSCCRCKAVIMVTDTIEFENGRRKRTRSSVAAALTSPSPSPSPSALQRRHQRDWSCPRCSRVFNKREHLERHVRSHTKEKPFTCTACSKSYGRRYV